MMTVVLLASALVLDLGSQRVTRADMQALADVVALDVARHLDGSKASVLQPSLQGWANASRDRNLDNLGDKPGVTPILGTVDATGVFTAVSGATAPSAVKVVATATVPFSLGGVTGVSSGTATRSAVASAEQTACFELGSYAAAILSENSTLLAPLNDLLGLNLDLISYKGLAKAKVSLADLVATGQVGTVDQVLGGSVTLGQFRAAALQVLQNQASSDNVAAIKALNDLVSAGANLGRPIRLGDVLSVAAGDTAALNSTINVLDLLGGSIAASNGEHALDIRNLNIAGITGGLYVTQGRQRACGRVNDPRAVAKASQIKANLHVPLAMPTGNSVLGLTVTGSVDVSGGIGNATGRLVGPPAVTCGDGTSANPDKYQVNVNGGLLGLDVNGSITLNGTVSTGLLGGLVDSLLGSLVSVRFNNVTIPLGATAAGESTSTQQAPLQVPKNAVNVDPPGKPVTTGSAYGGIGTLSTITTGTSIGGSITVKTGGILGLVGARESTVGLNYGPIGGLISTLLGTVNNTVNTVVNAAVVPTVNGLLKPLGPLLGINAGGADVFSVARPVCNGSRLSG